MFHNVEQNTDEWLQLRCGKLTSSSLGSVMANYPKAFGEPAKKLAIEIAIEQITGKYTESGYSNDHMSRGHEEEPLARALYEEENFCEVTNGGFFDGGFFGASPDGLVGDDGVIEIKSAIPSMHFARVKRQGLDPSYKWQCVANLKHTERDWMDFISYCGSFPPEGRLYVCRLHKGVCANEFQMIDERIETFKRLVEDSKNLINESNYRIY